MFYECNNPDYALQMLMEDIINPEFAVERESRNGKVMKFKDPVLILHNDPMQYLIMSPIRDANPIFHIMEAFWIITGQREVSYLLPFNSRYSEYAESDGRVHGAYGPRLQLSGQLNTAIELLKQNNDTRQVVVNIWDPAKDLTDTPYKDRPCNTQLFFNIEDGALNMSIQQRSGDLVWGTMGANRVCFALLMDYIAHAVGVKVGKMYQYVFNLHMYESVFEKYHGIVDEAEHKLPQSMTRSQSMFDGAQGATLHKFLSDATRFLVWGRDQMMSVTPPGPCLLPWMHYSMMPALSAYSYWKRKQFEQVGPELAAIEDDALRLNLTQWLMRRMNKNLSPLTSAEEK